METKEYISSGILELYVYGLLSETENMEVHSAAKNNTEIKNEILSIEKAIINLSTSFSPFLSVENFAKIKAKLDIKHSKVIELNPNKSNRFLGLGWAAAAILLIGTGYLYNIKTTTDSQLVALELDKSKLKQVLASTENKSSKIQKDLAVVRDIKNTVVALGGQTVSPTSYAKVYWNKETQKVYIDATGLPEPPEGMVYQVWSLKLKPTLTPTSIGLLANFEREENRIFEVSNTNDAEAFGITLEPAGGSSGPTMEQLYTLGKV